MMDTTTNRSLTDNPAKTGKAFLAPAFDDTVAEDKGDDSVLLVENVSVGEVVIEGVDSTTDDAGDGDAEVIGGLLGIEFKVATDVL